MLSQILTIPMVAFFLFLALGAGFFALAAKIAAPGTEHPGKREPYACGEEIEPNNILLTYHSFFRVALVFGILHIAALVISTIPKDLPNRSVAFFYLAAAAITMIILFEREEKID